MHDSDYEAMMRKGRSTALPIPQPAQTVEMCVKKPLVERKRMQKKEAILYKMSAEFKKKLDIVVEGNTTTHRLIK